MEKRTIERYNKRAILLHWVHVAAFVVLVLTGAAMFLPGVGPSGGYSTGIVHRVASVAFIASPVMYAIYQPGSILHFCKETFSWNKDDLKWFRAAPAYYFGGSEDNMPAQGRINTGQKMWQLVIFGTGMVFLITGAIMWFFKSALALDTYQWILFIHGIAFIIVFVMFLVHIYMGLLHPRMNESLRSMLDGKISPSYARSHYRKWYDRATDVQPDE